MDDTRRFDDEEIAEILERASSTEESSRQPVADGTGLTLPEIQEIGREVGIAPERIAEAARAVATRSASGPGPILLGTPVGVSRTAPLARAPTDAEWERIVADVRATFGATGKVEALGTSRTWRNGKLQVHIEPTGDGYRIRMQTVKGSASSLAASGGMMALVGAGLAAATALGWDPASPKPLLAGAVVGLIGLGQLAWVRLTLPRWAGERARQMEGVAERVVGLLGR